MMIKKITTFALGLLLTAGLWAQSGNNEMYGHAVKGGAKSITFPASNIQFWTGTGSNQAVVIVGWDDNSGGTNFALAWGVRWNGTATAQNMLDTIMAYDTRFSYTISGSFVTNVSYNDGTLVSGSALSYWCYNVNNSMASAYPYQNMTNGDVMEISSSCNFSLTSATAATNPNNTDPVDATIDTNDILYWVGNGSNRAVLIVNWGDPDTAFAWGYRFNGSVTAQTMVDSIAAADPRFWTVGSPSLNGDIHFVLSNGDTLGLVDGSSTPMGYNFWWTNKNGVSAGSGAATVLNDGDVFKYGDLSVGTGWDPLGTYFMEYAWEKTPTPVPAPNETPVDATIAPEDITYWVGEGPFEIVFAINWPDTALAWGYRFSARSTNLQNVMHDIAEADRRFSFVMGSFGVDDILFVENGDTLRKASSSWWEHTVNGAMSAGMYQQLNDGDFSRWADPTAGVVADSTYDTTWNYWMYTYAYPQTIYPVSEPQTASDTITAADIAYWIGEGSNEAIFVVNWADTALAWGYRFDGDSVNLGDMMYDLDHVDYRLEFTYRSNNHDPRRKENDHLLDIVFHNNGDTLSGHGSHWDFVINERDLGPNPFHRTYEPNANDHLYRWQAVRDGDFVRWFVEEAGVKVDSILHNDVYPEWVEHVYEFPQHITAASPLNAIISSDDIEYWVGEGSNKLLFVVNWADTALAWGYRFADDSVMLRTVMDDIVAVDPRFTYSEDGYLTDINFIENGDTLGVAPGSWWEHMLNGNSSMGMGQWMHDGDFSRWADPVAGVAVDSFYYDGWGWVYTYAYPRTIHAVSSLTGPFCGEVGSIGCTAVRFNDERIKGWATGCTIVRGSQNLSDPDAPAVTYGTEQDAIGPATTNTMDVVSLGDGGMATLTFATPIVNGDGFDFAVFENSFSDYFLELAVVEVSSDGEHFVRFPATSLTQTHFQIGGLGQVDPTFINNLAGKYRVGYGTPFDLDELRDSANIDINHITHVRVIDVVGSIDPQYGTYDAFGHIINDPFPTITHSAGFDLDGVAVLNEMLGIHNAEATALRMYPNPANGNVRLTFEAQATRSEVVVYDMAGRKVVAMPVEAGVNAISLNTAALADGVYMVRMGTGVEKLVVRH